MLLTLPELLANVSVNKLDAATAFTQYNHLHDLLIDVREPSEHQQKSVPDAINIPRGVLEMQMLQRYPNAEQTIYLHCASGGRAILAAEQLLRMGYKNTIAITCPIEKIVARS